MIDLWVIVHDDTDKIVAIFFNEDDYNNYMEENSIFSDLTGRRIKL